MVKRGQVAIFIIFALIILIAVIVVIAFKNNFLDLLRERQIVGIGTVPKEVMPVNLFILNCIEDVGERAISYVSFYGGYYDTDNISKNERGIPYYLFNQEVSIPSKQVIEKNLNLYINENLRSCTDGFSDFNQSFTIVEDEVISKATIYEDKINFYIKYSVKLSKDGKEYGLKFFSKDIGNNLNKVYDSVVLILNKQKNYTDICLSCLYDVAVLNNLSVKVYNPIKNEVEYTVMDTKYKTKDEQVYSFNFALRFKND